MGCLFLTPLVLSKRVFAKCVLPKLVLPSSVWPACDASLHAVYAGIFSSAVLAVNVIVSYQQKLSDFMADLSSEGLQGGPPVAKVE